MCIRDRSCGIGNFIGMLPDAMQDSKIYGVELDTISAGIAQQLYQKTTIAAEGFEETNLPDLSLIHILEGLNPEQPKAVQKWLPHKSANTENP